MRRVFVLAAVIAIAARLIISADTPAPAALAGVVTSAEEGAM
jgi:hypothetical protein